MNTMASAQFDSLQIDCGINRSVFDPIYAHYRNQWRAVERDGKIVAKWVMLTLFDQDEELLKARKLDENNLTLDRVCQPILPGTYYGRPLVSCFMASEQLLSRGGVSVSARVSGWTIWGSTRTPEVSASGT
jgi:hypothetical protein